MIPFSILDGAMKPSQYKGDVPRVKVKGKNEEQLELFRKLAQTCSTRSPP